MREWGRARRQLHPAHATAGLKIIFVGKAIQSKLTEEFRLVAFDLRGHGMSDAPEAQENTPSPSWA